MRLFCLARPPPIESVGKVVLAAKQRVRAIMQTFPEDRSNEDLNILLSFIRDYEFFRELESRKSTTKLMLCVSTLQGVQAAKGESIQNKCLDVKIAVVLAGNVILTNPSQKRKVREGECFDEEDLAFSTDVHSRNGCELAILKKEHFLQAMNFDWRSLRNVIDVLRTFPDLKQMKYEHLQFLAQHTVFDTYEFKQLVYDMDEEPQYWYGIVRGQFVMQKRVSHQSSGKNLVHATARHKLMSVGIVEAGQCFGEEEIFLATTRKTSVTCQSNDNQVLKIPAEQFMLVIAQYPRKASDLSKSVALKKEWKTQFEGKLEQTVVNYRKIINELGKSGEEREVKLPALSLALKKKSSNNSETQRLLHAISQTQKIPTSASNAQSVTITVRDNVPQETLSPNESESVAFGLTEFIPTRQNSQPQQNKVETNISHQITTEKSVILPDYAPLPLAKFESLRIDPVLEDWKSPRYRARSNVGTPTAAPNGLIGANTYIRQKEELLDKMRGHSMDQPNVLIPIELGKYQKLKVLQAVPQLRKHPPLNKGGKMLSLLREKAIHRSMLSAPKISPMKSPLAYPKEAIRPESLLQTSKFDQLFFKRLE